MRLAFDLVDVFAPRRLAGNGLAVFWPDLPLSTATLQALTREVRQYESIFVWRRGDDDYDARVFTLEEELEFAGHPVLGAAALLHRGDDARSPCRHTIRLGGRELPVHTVAADGGAIAAWMCQGAATLRPPATPDAADAALRALGLAPEDAHPALPPTCASTGLDYLIVPLRPPALARIHVDGPALARALAAAGAAFVYALAVGDVIEGRTWDRAGVGEDAATGSAAGPTAALLAAHGRLAPGATLELHQGRFVGRPSRLHVRLEGDAVWVGGDVRRSGAGWLELDEDDASAGSERSPR